MAGKRTRKGTAVKSAKPATKPAASALKKQPKAPVKSVPKTSPKAAALQAGQESGDSEDDEDEEYEDGDELEEDELEEDEDEEELISSSDEVDLSDDEAFANVANMLDGSESDEEENDESGEEIIEEAEQKAEENAEENAEAEFVFQSDDAADSDADSDASGAYSSDADSASSYSSDTSVTRYVPGADGKPRPLRPEIIPVYDSDDSDVEQTNTIGNIPLSAYDEYPHLGYDINGKRIMRPAAGSALDALLESIDLPEGWTGLLDQNTGSSLKLTPEELALIRKIQQKENPDESVNPYEPTIEWFTSKTETMPLTAIPEPKRRFVPSKHEAKRIMKIVRAIREGRIVPHKPEREADEFSLAYDLWGDSKDDMPDHIMHIPAPKMPLPTNEESYNPPEEYLLTPEEEAEWAATDPQDRERNFVPKKYGALRKVSGYGEAVRERFERCLDLYLAPRVRKQKLNIDPESLVPKLPSPQDLRPFPVRCSTVYRGHRGKVRALSVHPSGLWLATGGDDGTVRVWEVLTGREVWKLTVVKKAENEEDNVEALEWNPEAEENGVLAVAAGNCVYIVVPAVLDLETVAAGQAKVESGWSYAAGGAGGASGNGGVPGNDADGADGAEGAEDSDDEAAGPAKRKDSPGQWIKPTNARQVEKGLAAVVQLRRTVKQLSWHRKGDYFVTVSPEAANSAVVIHQLSKHSSQCPFRKSRGIVQQAKFHPFRPHLYVATQRYIRVYDLQQQVLSRKLQPGARWLSSFDVHPRGDNVIAGSFDKRVVWHDLDLSDKPYKTLRYHEKAVRDVVFHRGGLPLFCSASDDGSINVFHATVYDDLMTNPLLVPLKILRGHTVTNSLGILRAVWHPREAWLFSAGADGTCRLWTT